MRFFLKPIMAGSTIASEGELVLDRDILTTTLAQLFVTVIPDMQQAAAISRAKSAVNAVAQVTLVPFKLTIENRWGQGREERH